ncbi:uncharacterized protein BDZ99DRAFT_515730 [Mytilinidion resinicola]|uniref:lytic cellulose monooxygenase (C4-dehydrogenating) n=1 Tax=Mytilinidion resinicola TaxID=574789 RepID=A0A6A6Z1D0_9PEZI|nr:uncharacterized protein BDZ99DRAFT_515730 [Mytilinidion resinicola]KAF2814966.1 hypothetical protein BDZ99DRAFT_515730 [Mytilinidion resinicola]
MKSLAISVIAVLTTVDDVAAHQLTVSGGGSASPATVNFPGAYSASYPVTLINIHAVLSTYVVSSPAVYSGGSKTVAGSGCNSVVATRIPNTTLKTSASPVSTSVSGGGGNSAGCTAVKYDQCGGETFSGCATCAGVWDPDSGGLSAKLNGTASI